MLNVRPLILILATLLAAGCQTSTFKDFDLNALLYPGSNRLKQGIQKYDEGNFRVATRHLQSALEEGLRRPDRVEAHKYLAFIACVSSQPQTCREEFAIALELNPNFQLAPAEAGHPIWGPVFKSVKGKQPKQP